MSADNLARPGSNPYVPMSMEILRITDEVDDRTIKSLDLRWVHAADRERFAHIPGQFCELSVLGQGEAPFGIASSPVEREFIRFTISRAGVVTTMLHSLKPGDVIGMRGPLGNTFPMELLKGHDIVIIGGGFAFTTLRSLIVTLLNGGQRDQYGRITVIYGTRMPGLMLYKSDLAAWQQRDDITLWQTIDRDAPDWPYEVGFVPAVVERVAPAAENAIALIAGPPVMIRFTLPVMSQLGFAKDQIYTSLENRMKCGIGKCGRCNVGPKYVCLDGPVFSLAQLEQLPPEY
jgi:NAD(P)H-flavin reductase